MHKQVTLVSHARIGFQPHEAREKKEAYSQIYETCETINKRIHDNIVYKQ
jgi:fructosamine-3-kinase